MDVTEVIGSLFEMQEGARSHVELYDAIKMGEVDESVTTAALSILSTRKASCTASSNNIVPKTSKPPVAAEQPHASPSPAPLAPKKITLNASSRRVSNRRAARVRVKSLKHSD
jgi:hypothetical protein